MKLSARNMLKGTVKSVTRGAVAAQVKVDIGGGNVITSTVTVDAIEDLGIAEGKPITVIIKASEVILGTE
ncbi:MAG: TOBE domain-containing protein [Rhodobiaceae bacterium]|mgnify:CR=1 FL=1|nr:TOBE domain-containing protein [Rhodobiaceae bacterium]MCC0015635.1 TOBE domain-containing protein [Rhodobiaceae bacterium]MCC0042531.1 TOBE domain-containing protein [Rhodobiaceae bacterium]